MRPATAFEVDTDELASSLRRIASALDRRQIDVVRATTAETTSTERDDPLAVQTLMLRYIGPAEYREKIRYVTEEPDES